MDKLSLGLTALLMLALVMMMAPNVLALNRGKILRNIAIWLAIVAGLALVYKNFGPGSTLLTQVAPPSGTVQEGAPAAPDGKGAGKDAVEQGFTPPGE